jgi:hypothetical protein
VTPAEISTYLANHLRIGRPPSALDEPTATGLRKVGQFSLTDRGLFAPFLSNDAKRILGFSVNYPNLDPSLLALKKIAGMRKDNVIAAQNELEDTGVVKYDRPSHFYDRRSADDPRFDFSNRITAIHQDFDPFRHGNATASLPPEIVKQLPRGTKNAGLYPLVALYLVREQLRRGGIHEPWQAVQPIFHLNRKQLPRIVTALETILQDEGDDILSIPGATPTIDALAVEKERTRTIRPVSVRDDLAIPVLCNEAEGNKIAVLLDELAQPLAEWAFVDACLDQRNYAHELEDGIVAEAAIDALLRFRDDPPYYIGNAGFRVFLLGLREYVLAAAKQGRGRWGALHRPFGGLTPAVRGPGKAVPLTTYPELQAAPPRSAEDYEPDDLDQPPEEPSDEASSSDENLAGVEEWTAHLGLLPSSYNRVSMLFDGRIPRQVRENLDHALNHFAYLNNGDPWNTEQKEELDYAVEQKFTEAPYDDDLAGKIRFANNRASLLRGDDDLYDALKARRDK